MGRLSVLTTGELAKTIDACEWLTRKDTALPFRELLDPMTAAKVSTLLADCHAEAEDRYDAARASRADAVAGRRDPMEHYSG